MNAFVNEHKYHLISLSTSVIFLMTTIQRYHRVKNEYDHYERRHRMLHSITTQKRDELDHVIDHINQLLLLENRRTVSLISDNRCVYDHGDHPSIFSLENYLVSEKDDEESEDDALLERLKRTKPTRLKISSRQSVRSHRNPSIDFTDVNIVNEVHGVYDGYLCE